jgi:hypothetical protein
MKMLLGAYSKKHIAKCNNKPSPTEGFFIEKKFGGKKSDYHENECNSGAVDNVIQ